jgi:outer membrane protein assembly factor BamD (BamD/ComL family)
MMSITSIGGSALLSQLYVTQNTQNNQNQFQQIQTDFQQLGQDLQTGNLTQAQQDFAALQQQLPSGQGQTQQNNASPITQAFTALSQALQSGNLQDAQTAFTTLQDDIQQQQGSGQVRHHHHHGGNDSQGPASANAPQSNPIATAFSSLAQALQSGDLSGAQSAFATLQQDLTEQFGAYAASNASTNGTSPAITGGTLNVSA